MAEDKHLPDADKTVHNKKRRFKVRKGSKYDYYLVGIAERLVASGHTEQDLGYILGVSPRLIKSWKERHPEFKEDCNAGYTIANAITLAQFLRSCWGFEYDEVRRIYDGKGKLVRRTVITKYQSPNADLLKFELINKRPEEYRDPRRIDINTKSLFGIIAGEPESAQIEGFFGLTKDIISDFEKEPAKLKDGKYRPVDAGASAEVDSKGLEPEHRVSKDAPRQAGEGQGDAEGVSPALLP